MSKVIGIDLGTSNSVVSVLDGKEPMVIHNQEGGRTTPSMVSWTAEGDVVVGASSKRQMVTNPKRTIFGAKRLIGRQFKDDEVQEMMKHLPYDVVQHTNGDAWIQVGDSSHAPPEISSFILAKMRAVAEDYLGESVSEAVITVPAYFDDVQRQATKDAGMIAGLEVRAIINEPTAAALAYGLQTGKDQRIVVFDLGGGTFDVSILTIEDGVFEVLATNGDTGLGGDDFDRALIDLICDEFKEAHDVDMREDSVALQRLKESVERAKVELSTAMSTHINLPFIAANAAGPVHLERELSRGEFESAAKGLLARLEGPCAEALSDARCEPADIDQVLLVGGMTRMPAVQSRVVEIFGKEPSKGVNPDEIVAMGAAAHSGVMGGELQEVVLLDVTPHPLGVKTSGNRMSVVIPGNTTIPTRESKTYATTEDSQTFVTIEVYQGPGENVKDNRRLGRFVLSGLPEDKAGKVRVTVSFSIDADGILQVTAVDQATGNEAKVTIEAASGLSAGEIESIRDRHA